MSDTRWDLLLTFLAGIAAMAGLSYLFWRQYGRIVE